MGNTASPHKKINSWSPLMDYKDKNISIWLSPKETEKVIRNNFSFSQCRFVFNSYLCTMKIEQTSCSGSGYVETESCQIPFIGHTFDKTLTTAYRLPEGIRIARRDLWTIHIFEKWIDKILEIDKKLLKIFGTDVVGIIDHYLDKSYCSPISK